MSEYIERKVNLTYPDMPEYEGRRAALTALLEAREKGGDPVVEATAIEEIVQAGFDRTGDETVTETAGGDDDAT